MKKIFLILLVLISAVVAFAQYPAGRLYTPVQRLGSDSAMVKSYGGFTGRLVNWSYTDTTAANLTAIKNYAGAQIFTTSDSSVWVRNTPANRWLLGSGGSIENIINNNFTTITNLGDTAAIICTGVDVPVCDTFFFNIDSINNIFFINDTMLVACDTPQVIQVGDDYVTQQLCDTIRIPKQLLYRFYNGVQEIAPGNVVFGSPSEGFSLSQLQYTTYLNTDFYGLFISGKPPQHEVLKISNNQNPAISASIFSLGSLGRVSVGSIDSNNTVRLYTNYVTPFDGDTTGFLGDRIGYMINTNGVGTFNSLTQDHAVGKQSGLVIHTKDTLNTDGVTIFASQDPLSLCFTCIPAPTETLYDKRVAVFKTTGQAQLPQYGDGNYTGTETYLIAEDADGNLIEFPPGGLPGGGALITADNAITANTATNVQLGSDNTTGSPLLHTTYINTGTTFSLIARGTGVATVLTGLNTSAGVGVYGESSSGYGVFGKSNTGIGGYFQTNPTSTNSVAQALYIGRSISGGGTAANGIGASIDFLLQSVSSAQISNQIITKWTDATTATRTSQFVLTGVNNAVTSDLFTLSGSGETRLNKYGVGTFTAGTGTYLIATKADGTLMEFPTGGLPGGGALVTADNGLTTTSSTNVQLGDDAAPGAPLLHDTYIDATASYRLFITGSIGSQLFNVSNTGSGTSIFANSSGAGDGVYGQSATGVGVRAISSGAGVGVVAQSGTGLILEGFTSGVLGATLQINPAATNTVLPVLQLSRSTSGTGANGIGGSLEFYNESTTGQPLANQIISKWVDATNATRTSQLDITAVGTASTNTIMSAYGSGVVGIGISSAYTATRLEVVDNAVGAASIVKVTSTSTAAASNLQRGIDVSLSGATSNANQTTIGISSSNAHTGSGASINFGISGAASGGNANYGVYGTDGSVGLLSAPSTAGVVGTGVYGVYGFTNNSTAAGVYGFNSHASGGTGVLGIAGGASAKGVWGSSTAGIGVQGDANSGIAVKALLAPSDATPSTVRTILELAGATNTIGNVPGNGYGVNTLWTIYTNNGGITASRTAADQYVRWTDITDASRTSEMVLDIITDADQHNTLLLSGTQSKLYSRDAATNQTAERYHITGTYKTLTESSATAFVRVNVPTGTITGGEIEITVQADDGTDFQSRTLTFPWSAVNKAGTITSNIGTPVESVSVSAGTLTVTIDANDAGSGNLDIRANATSSLAQTTLRCSYQVKKNFGVGAITPQ